MEDIEIAKKVEKAGGRLYLVGGALRDKFLGKEEYDEDYCITGLTDEEFIKIFPEAIIKGKAFKVYEIDKKEIALARKEIKTGKTHKEFKIKTNKNILLEEDLERRDITINSIAQDVLTKEIIDPFEGRKDLKNKIIRATSPKFIEDPLRVYRVARFAAKLEFNVEEKTIEMMKSIKNELKYLPKERVFMEFKKALETNKPSIFFDVLKKAEVLDVNFMPIYKLIGALQPKKYHPEGDSYNHTMIALDKACNETTDLKIRFSVLVHDLGKGETPKEEYPHHYNHEKRGVKIVERFSSELGVPKSWEKCGKVACLEHMRGGIFNKMKPAKKVEFIERIDKTILGLHGLQIVVNCDKSRNDEVNKELYDFETIGKKCLKEVTAKKLIEKYNLKEGKSLGERLHQERVEWMKTLTN